MKNKAGNMQVSLAGVQLPNPIIPASGTFGFGYEMADWYDINCLGAIALKGTTQHARFGNPTPRIAECVGGMLNAVGLQNPGVEKVIAEELPKLREVYNGVVIANISGFSIEEYVYTAEKFEQDKTAQILEINISCPNVQHGGMAFGMQAKAAQEVTAAVRKVVKKPMFIKLSPNVGSITEIAKACADAGADGLVLINTLLGMRIEPKSGKPIVSTGMCGFSGPAIKPVALRMVYEVAGAVNLPIIGVGGITSAEDVIEFMSAGATAVQVGSQNLIEPCACKDIINSLPLLMQSYGISSLTEIIGRARK